MLTSTFIALGVLVLAFLGLLWYRIFIGRRYSNLLGLVAVICFGGAYIFYAQTVASVLDSSSAFKGVDSVRLRNFFGSVFCLSIAYFMNALIKHFVYPRRLTWEGDSKVPLLVQYVVTAILYLVALTAIVGIVYGQSITGLLAASGAALLVFGYSARSMLDEVFSGIAINIKAPFEKGDLIQLNDEWGYVKDIGWRSITYLDMDNNYVELPNSKVAASKIRNLDRPTSVTRRVLYISVEYNIPPQVVIDECNAAIKECPKIIPHPWNFAAYYKSDEKGMQYRVHFHVKHFDDWWHGSDQFLNALWYRFTRRGIRFSHQRKLNFMTQEDERRWLRDSAFDDANWRSLVERFNQVPIFEGMTPDDTEEIARLAQLHIIGPPERVIRAGSKRTSMFLIASGAADVFEVDEHGNETWMASIGESETIGLMSLLTGRPQRTTIRAKQECAVWEIGSESLHALFDRKPEIMEDIAASVARWQAEEEDAIKSIAMNRQQEKQFIQQRTNRLTRRIAHFFQRELNDEDGGEEFTNY